MNTQQEEEVVNTPPTKRVEINDENPHVLIAVYGTLRRGQGNYNAILRDTKSEYLGTHRSEPKYTMFGRRAGFPVVTNGKSPITYELFKVTEQEVVNNLHSLESCTGIPGDAKSWYDIVPINTPAGMAWMYLQHNFDHGPHSVIPTGDWLHKSL